MIQAPKLQGVLLQAHQVACFIDFFGLKLKQTDVSKLLDLCQFALSWQLSEAYDDLATGAAQPAVTSATFLLLFWMFFRRNHHFLPFSGTFGPFFPHWIPFFGPFWLRFSAGIVWVVAATRCTAGRRWWRWLRESTTGAASGLRCQRGALRQNH